MNNVDIFLDSTTDEGFFASMKGESSKLQQLFVDDALSTGDIQQSLKYQRPKEILTSSNAANITLMAKVVTAYRQGEWQGKVGLALIENSNETFNIIMYKAKTHILATLKFKPGEHLLYKQTKYWQFYDDSAVYWSFSFDNQLDEDEFVDRLRIKNITFEERQEKEEVPEERKLHIAENIPGIKETKNTLIRRMAKMGKPLPTLLPSNQQTDFSDSSDIEIIQTPLASAQKPSIVSRSNKISPNKVSQQLVPSIVSFNEVGTTSNDCCPIKSLESQYMHMMLTEQRTQGSELRMNMIKLENKIEKVLDKLEIYDRDDGKQRMEKEDEILQLEEKLLTLKKENRKLKQNLPENATKESEEKKIKDLLYELKGDLNHFNIDYNQDIKSILMELNYKLKESYNNLQEVQQKLDDKEIKLKELKQDLELKVIKTIDQQDELSLLKQKENELKLHLKEKDTEIQNQKLELSDIQNQLQVKGKETCKNFDATLVKSIMNKLYMDIADKINNTNVSHREQILSLIASSIKDQTLKSLEEHKSKDV